MKKEITYLSMIVAIFGLASALYSKNRDIETQYSSHFSTPRDLAAVLNSSGLKLKNAGSSTKIVYGLYVRQFSYVASGQSCASATVMYASSQNNSAGSMVMPVSILANAEASISANYLYNMIYNAIYYIQILFPSSPPGCALPGCTWGSDTTIYNWCIYVGALAPVSVTASYTASVAPAMSAVSAGGYDYNLIGSYETIGPISCNDQLLTCSVSTPQTQSF